jgi:hypothetical protein
MLKPLASSILSPSLSLLALCAVGGTVLTLANSSSSLRAEPRVDAIGSGPSLADFCAREWGELADHGRYCRFEQWYHLNLRHAGEGMVITGIPVLPGDTVRVEATSVPQALVGTGTYDASEEKIVSSTAGYLAFRAPHGQGIFSVERVGLERCFVRKGSSIDAAACPEEKLDITL